MKTLPFLNSIITLKRDAKNIYKTNFILVYIDYMITRCRLVYLHNHSRGGSNKEAVEIIRVVLRVAISVQPF